MASLIQCGQESIKQVCVYVCRSRGRQALFIWISYEAGAGGSWEVVSRLWTVLRHDSQMS